ncbi:protein-disulfide reductase DsbD domain-containing protein [Runella sp.]|uniref:protein-disulfide reductase DsbD domain-containing protein n=1 Tax=Runella sp. TaxID=1960881 RepID=UPI003D105F02
MKILTTMLLLCAICWFANAQQEVDINKVTHWQFKFANEQFNQGEEVEIIFLAEIEKGWSLYSSDFKADIGPQPTAFEFAENGSFAVTKAITAVSPLKKVDKTWGTQITYFTQKAEFRSKVRIEEINYDVTGTIRGQLCNDKKGVCIPFQKTFHFIN